MKIVSTTKKVELHLRKSLFCSLFWSFVSSFLQDDDTTAMDEDVKVLHKPDPAFQETLIGEVIPDPMEGEQTWPTEEELREAGYLIILYLPVRKYTKTFARVKT